MNKEITGLSTYQILLLESMDKRRKKKKWPPMRKVVFRWRHYKVSRDGRVVMERRGTKGKYYYRHMCVCNRGSYFGVDNYWGKKRFVFCYMLVAIAYCKGRKPGLMVHHKDHVKTNDHYKNLEWITRSENARLAHEFHKARKLELKRKDAKKRASKKRIQLRSRKG